MRRAERCAAGFVCILFILAGAIAAPVRADTLVNVDFNTASSSTYTGAAVLGAAGDKWNGISESVYFDRTTQSVNNLCVITSDGAASGLQLSYTLTQPQSEPGMGAFDSDDSTSPFFGTPYESLMRDYFFVRSGTGSFTISGLTAGGTYKLVIYSGTNSAPGGAAAGRNTAFTIDALTRHVVQANHNTFVDGANFTTFDTTADGGGAITFTMAAGSFNSLEPDVNGFQLLAEHVAVPLPSAASAGLVLLAGLVVGASFVARQPPDAAIKKSYLLGPALSRARFDFASLFRGSISSALLNSAAASCPRPFIASATPRFTCASADLGSSSIARRKQVIANSTWLRSSESTPSSL